MKRKMQGRENFKGTLRGLERKTQSDLYLMLEVMCKRLTHITFQVIMAMTVQAQFHVLAVDDSLIDRMLIERLLKTSSFHVTTVDSATKALKFLGLVEDELRTFNSSVAASDIHQDVDVNLIITDYCMPGMTGYDLLRKIKMLGGGSGRILSKTSSTGRCKQTQATFDEIKSYGRANSTLKQQKE
ncbi:hypothetical protein Fmac_025435 [Flemingia macrophylla]|uniref:Response regulatory domain-containing protein n=1 Tax=Flemingia macrophylla TaxID=520843 RepID=A0ABD1LS82_9FABA